MFVANKAFIENKEGRVLMMRDAGNDELHAYHKGLWDIPGGRMNREDDSLLDGLVREVLEETGIELNPDEVELFGQIMWDVNNDRDNRIAAFLYRVRVDSPSPKCSAEHVEFTWVDPKDIDLTQYKSKMPEILSRYLKKYAKS